MNKEISNFEKLRAINVNEHTEKKGNLTYLFWAWAVDQLLQQDPAATWEYKEPKQFGDSLMVFCTVTAFNKSMTAQLPVMDYKNKAISNPDSMAVNTAMQRCLAKAIALHGLGLYIYAGEDTPEAEAKGEVIAYAEELTAAAEKGETMLHKVWTKIATEMGKEKAAQFWAINGNHFKSIAKEVA